MAEFTPIQTQEEYQARFNADLGDRLKKNEEKWSKKFEGFLSPDEVTTKTKALEEQIASLTTSLEDAQKQIESHSQTVAEKDARIKAFEIQTIKNQIALDAGLSHDAVSFLQGEDEESIRASAEALKGLVGTSTVRVPAYSNEPSIGDAQSKALKEMLKGLKIDL